MVDEQSEGFESVLDDFFAWCASSGCPWRPAGGASATALLSLIAQSRTQALPAGAGPTARGPVRIYYAVLSALYARSYWPNLANALAQAAAGNGAGVLSMADSYVTEGSSNAADAETAIDCLDHPVARGSAGIPALAAQAAVNAPFFGPLLAWGEATCAVWPVPATRTPQATTAVGSPPIVVVGATKDPATPYVWAQRLAAELQHGELVTWQGENHVAYYYSGVCPGPRPGLFRGGHAPGAGHGLHRLRDRAPVALRACAAGQRRHAIMVVVAEVTSSPDISSSALGCRNPGRWRRPTRRRATARHRRARASPWRRAALPVGVVGLVVGCLIPWRDALHRGVFDDTFWHRAAGVWMLDHHRVMSTDVFSYTVLGEKWITPEWGYDVVLAQSVRSVGPVAFWLLVGRAGDAHGPRRRRPEPDGRSRVDLDGPALRGGGRGGHAVPRRPAPDGQLLLPGPAAVAAHPGPAPAGLVVVAGPGPVRAVGQPARELPPRPRHPRSSRWSPRWLRRGVGPGDGPRPPAAGARSWPPSWRREPPPSSTRSGPASTRARWASPSTRTSAG